MFNELTNEELKELKQALNCVIERRITFKSQNKQLNKDNVKRLDVDYKLLRLVINELQTRG